MIRKAEESNNNQSLDTLESKLSYVDNFAKDLLTDIGETASRVLCLELEHLFKKEFVGSDDFANLKLTRVTSAYVPGIATPNLEQYDEISNEIKVPADRLRKTQRVVSPRGFYGSSTNRQDSVILAAPSSNADGKITLWVGKVFGIFRTPSSSLRKRVDVQDQEVAFVQYYEIVPPQDNIDQALHCIRIKWCCGDSDDAATLTTKMDSGVKWFNLLPISSIRGRVHVVRDEYGMNGNGVTKDMGLIPWQEQHFYINRFYFDSQDTKYTYDEDLCHRYSSALNTYEA